MSRENCAAYVELHCHSNFSFQEGASFPHELLARAAELGYPALALTDHDNLCGAMEFARTARSLGIHPIIGAEVTLSSSARTGVRGCPPDSSSSNRAGLASLEEERPPDPAGRDATGVCQPVPPHLLVPCVWRTASSSA